MSSFVKRTNNAKICFTRTTHSKTITMIRVSCLSCPRHESNCQHYRYRISAAAGHLQTNPSRVRLIELSLSSYSFIRYPLFTYLSYWMDQCEWSSCVVRSLYKMASQDLSPTGLEGRLPASGSKRTLTYGLISLRFQRLILVVSLYFADFISTFRFSKL